MHVYETSSAPLEAQECIYVCLSVFHNRMRNQQYEDRVKLSPIKAFPWCHHPPFLESLLKSYDDCFPDPDGLPKHRRVELELNVKHNAKPSSRDKFRFQGALSLFVEELLHKGWIEMYDSYTNDEDNS